MEEKNLQQDAHKIIEEYLVRNAKTLGFNGGDTSLKTWSLLFPRAVVISPDDPRQYMHMSLVEKIEASSGQEILLGTFGEMVKSMDFYSNPGLTTNPAELVKFIPELSPFAGYLSQRDTWGVIMPYTLSLSLPPGLSRNLGIVVASKKDLELIDRRKHGGDLKLLVSHGLPTLGELVRVAHEYSVDKVQQAMFDHQKAFESYRKK